MLAAVSSTWESNAPGDDSELRRYLQVLRRRKWLLILCLTIVPLTAYLVAAQGEKRYEATATIQVEPTGVEPLADLGATTRALAATVRLAETLDVARAASGRLGDPPRDIQALRDSVVLTTDAEAGFVTVTADAPAAERSAEVANAYAAAIQSVRTQRAQRLIDVSIEETRSASDGSRRGDENASLEQLQVARAEQKNKTQVIEPATTPAGPVAPRPLRMAILGFVVALLVGLGLVFLLDALDRHLREPEEVDRLLGSRLLGSVPASALPGRDSTGEVHEAFQMLRATLTYFNVAPLRSVMVTSPVGGDGKTTVATNLAKAFARSGKRVTLIDADLRRPRIDQRLLDEPARRGLGAVLAGTAELDDAVQFVDAGGGELRVLPAGPPPPNPSELLGSEQMRELLEQLQETSDLVILDTAPTLLVSDGIPLLSQVSGVVVVARIGHTPRKALTEVGRLLASARAKVLGAVVNGVPDHAGYGYGYGYEEKPGSGSSGLGRSKRGRENPAESEPVGVRATARPGDARGGLGS